jgi:predicted Zn finger-like uncharacterized protein
MSLATRCPACSTVFRVVQDQLRVSEGWVRCGQCQEVFNALETLFDLGDGALDGATEAAVDAQTGTAADALGDTADFGDVIAEGPLPEDHWNPSPPPAPSARAAPADAPEIGSTLATAQAASAAAPPLAPAAPPMRAVTSPPAPARPVESVQAADQPTEQFVKRLGSPAPAVARDPGEPAPEHVPAADLRQPSAPSRRPAPAKSAPAPEAASDLDRDEPTPSRFIGPSLDWARKPVPSRRRDSTKAKGHRPSVASQAPDAPHPHAHVTPGAQRRRRKPEFVRQAERAALWRRPAVRAALGTAAGLLGTMLMLQVAYEYREPLAAHVPALRPALQAGCAQVGCRIGAPRAIERIRLDASDLSRTDQEQVLRFTADLHNGADFAVRAPALEVNFTDALGRLVSRKVLQPAELGLRSEAIEADTPWRIDTRLAVGDLRIAGYTVEVFYP